VTVIASGMAETPSIASAQVCVFNNATNQAASLVDYQSSPIADLRTHWTRRRDRKRQSNDSAYAFPPAQEDKSLNIA
jgi:hypothetical protein